MEARREREAVRREQRLAEVVQRRTEALALHKQRMNEDPDYRANYERRAELIKSRDRRREAGPYQTPEFWAQDRWDYE